MAVYVPDAMSTNLTGNESEMFNESNGGDIMTSQKWLRAVFIIVYSAIFLLGISGNSLVVHVVARNKSMHTITNIFITNLAVSDIAMCLLAVPFTPISALMQNWFFGETLCHIVPMTLGVSVHVSTLTSTAIAIDRYFVIVHPFKPRMNVAVCLALIIAIWVTSISISLPLAIYQKVSWSNDDEYICHESWPQKTARQFFTVTSLVLQYIIRAASSSTATRKCHAHSSRAPRPRSARAGKARDREEMEIKRKRRTNRMLIAMVSIFVCCWLPLNVLHVAAEYDPGILNSGYYMLTFLIVHVIAMSSTIYNPFLYAWMNDNFKKEFKTVLPACLFSARRCSGKTNGAMSQYTTVDTAVPPPNSEHRPMAVEDGGGRGSCCRVGSVGGGGCLDQQPPIESLMLLQDMSGKECELLQLESLNDAEEDATAGDAAETVPAIEGCHATETLRPGDANEKRNN